jgi:hypothetical protein
MVRGTVFILDDTGAAMNLGDIVDVTFLKEVICKSNK